MRLATDALEAFKNEREYIAKGGRLKTTVAAMDWAAAEIERLRNRLLSVGEGFAEKE